jgi:hypothetical protein
MVTAINYNCTPDSLGDVGQSDFVEAFENEIRVRPLYRDLKINVTFEPAVKSEITGYTTDGDDDLTDGTRAEFYYLAEKAFKACCEG